MFSRWRATSIDDPRVLFTGEENDRIDLIRTGVRFRSSWSAAQR